MKPWMRYLKERFELFRKNNVNPDPKMQLIKRAYTIDRNENIVPLGEDIVEIFIEINDDEGLVIGLEQDMRQPNSANSFSITSCPSVPNRPCKPIVVISSAANLVSVGLYNKDKTHKS
ncbi:hypothetical protein [Francisella philomiragia]|uniref:Uncharacterized protein n=1 Tax=Francisella philomiragia TaxID=28110 RepID=A0ABS1GEA1_9GAMM|nr:hypothetical protein [Francisella philomiragia]MBK2259104.1 hypothetical protein [Francisella philomiragia]MBK2302859.1 hypothetical protein [Francisella philomiragia]